jgi:large subunit ribosomal protein L30
MADTIRIKLVRSPIGTTQRVRETLRGLGLNRIGRERELVRTPMVEGMLRRVSHLVTELKPGPGHSPDHGQGHDQGQATG